MADASEALLRYIQNNQHLMAVPVPSPHFTQPRNPEPTETEDDTSPEYKELRDLMKSRNISADTVQAHLDYAELMAEQADDMTEKVKDIDYYDEVGLGLKNKEGDETQKHKAIQELRALDLQHRCDIGWGMPLQKKFISRLQDENTALRSEIANKDAVIDKKDSKLVEKDSKLVEKDQEIAAQKEEIARLESLLLGRTTGNPSKVEDRLNQVIAGQDAVLAGQDAGKELLNRILEKLATGSTDAVSLASETNTGVQGSHTFPTTPSSGIGGGVGEITVVSPTSPHTKLQSFDCNDIEPTN